MHVRGVTSNPTIFAQRAGQGRRLRRAGGRPGRARGERGRGGQGDHHLRHPLGLRRAAAGLRRDRRRRRPGVDRGRSAAGGRHREDRSPRRGRCGGWWTGPTCSSRSRPPRRACPRSPSAWREGISVNVTLIFSLQRYGAGHRRVHGRPGAGRGRATCPGSARWPRSSSAGWTPRSTAGWTSSARRRRAALRGKAAVANARLAYELFEQRLASDRWPALRGQRGPAAAAAVGIDQHQGPGLPGHDVRDRPGRAGHREHHAGGHAARHGRPRRAARRHRSTAATSRPVSCSSSAGGAGHQL